MKIFRPSLSIIIALAIIDIAIYVNGYPSHIQLVKNRVRIAMLEFKLGRLEHKIFSEFYDIVGLLQKIKREVDEKEKKGINMKKEKEEFNNFLISLKKIGVDTDTNCTLLLSQLKPYEL